MHPFVLKGHERPVTIVRFNYDGDLFFSGSAENKINLWEAYTGERIGSFQTKASVRSLDVDINSRHLIACSNDGSFEVFNVQTGEQIRLVKFQFKLKQVQFNSNSEKFLLLQDEYSVNTPSMIKVIQFEKVLKLRENYETAQLARGKLQPTYSFSTVITDDNKPNKTSTRALWYIDDASMFVATSDGLVIHYQENGEIIKKAVIHDGTKINSLAFSKDFSILATAADNGAKILDPETLEILRYFKQELAMNSISISPLFCAAEKPKFHMVMGGGMSAITTAMTGGSAGFQARVCNIMHGTEVGTISGHFGPINSIEFFRDGRGFVSGGEEGIIRVVRFSQIYFEENNPQFQ